MKKRPITTLFMLESLDGKISSGSSDNLDILYYDKLALIDGEAITSSDELDKLKALELIECNKLDNSYIQLKYKVKK